MEGVLDLAAADLRAVDAGIIEDVDSTIDIDYRIADPTVLGGVGTTVFLLTDPQRSFRRSVTMVWPTTFDKTRDARHEESTTRRGFVRGLGFGALGVSLLPGDALFAARQAEVEFQEDVFGEALAPIPCPVQLWSTDRVAGLLGEINVLFCDPCPCDDPQFHDNWDSRLIFRTNFLANGTECDELSRVPMEDPMTMKWDLRVRRVRANGPLGTPIGYFDGRFHLFDPGGVRIITGRIAGVLGFDPCIPPSSGTRCDHYPEIRGMLFGRGVSGTPFEGCIVRWVFCGNEGPVICDPFLWEVGITGIVECPCPPGS